MMLVAACPGGNVSNFFTHLAAGNTALSVSMTAISTLAAIVMTPVNLAFWGRLDIQTAAILQRVSLDPVQLFATIFTILGLPLFLGMLVAHIRPNLAAKLRKPFKILSIGFFVAFVAIAFAVNFEHFLNYITGVIGAVFLHNALALSTGYGFGRLLRLPKRDARAVSIEVGIQNSALALALIFDFFAGLGGMAIVAASWGIWHLISGLSLAWFWSRRPV
jgi:BASS family bile acid:Na+ symporter